MSTTITDVQKQADQVDANNVDKTADDRDEPIRDPKYAAKSERACSFIQALERLDHQERMSLRNDTQNVIEAAKFVMAYIRNNSGSRMSSMTIREQLIEVRKLALVARLWASHPTDDGEGTIGGAIGRVTKPDRYRSAEALIRRMIAHKTPVELLEKSMEDAVFYIKQGGVSVNWQRLLIDLESWADGDVKLRWASDFYKRLGGY